MVRPPMSASRWVRFTMPMPNTMRVTCWGSELTRLRRLPPAPGGLLGVAGSCCSFSKITLQSGSEGRRPLSVDMIYKYYNVTVCVCKNEPTYQTHLFKEYTLLMYYTKSPNFSLWQPLHKLTKKKKSTELSFTARGANSTPASRCALAKHCPNITSSSLKLNELLEGQLWAFNVS